MRAPVGVSARHLHRLVAVDGGFTVNARSGRPVRRGIAVCSRPSRSLAFPWDEWADERVGAWLVARSAEQGRGQLHVGGWLDPRSDDVWLDVVHVVSPAMRQAACVIARALRQHCVFDLGRQELVIVGGDRR